MRKLVRCYNQFQGESEEQTYLCISNAEINVQMETKLAFSLLEEESQLNLQQVEFACVDKNYWL